MTAIVVLGMHRSGTSCLAGMLTAAGLASAGESVRGWDNRRGHHEMLDAVRLNEAVLAHSGGHWLSPPPRVRWTEEQARLRDRLLGTLVDGRPALLKDPRTLLVLPFWRAANVPFHVFGIVRHPVAVARSLESWRGTPLADGIALWLSHNRALEADQRQHRYPLIDFDRVPSAVVAAVADACARAGLQAEPARLAAAFDESLVHHDEGGAVDTVGHAEALGLHAELLARVAGTGIRAERRPFPRAQLTASAQHLERGQVDEAMAAIADALVGCADPVAVLVPAVTLLIRHRCYQPARALIDSQRGSIDAAFAHLLRGKVLLAAGNPSAAAEQLIVACAAPEPLFQARHLLPQALRQAGRHIEARASLAQVADHALYPHGPLATLAEWAWLDGDLVAAALHLDQAIAAAPVHRRGRLRTRRAELLLALGDSRGARAHLEQALSEDPGYTRAQSVLDTLLPPR